VFLDLGAVTFIDSSGMTAMLLSAQRLGDEGKDLRIVAASSTVARTIDLAGLQEVLPMQGD
jgi:anti-anti-sigma factor